MKGRLTPLHTAKMFNKEQKCQPHAGTRGKVMGSPSSLEFILKGPWTNVANFTLGP